MSKLVVATRNKGKLNEITSILASLNVEVVSVLEFPSAPEVEETGSTLEENAFIKAQSVFDATGLPSLADDTGLEVHSLDMHPGVRSARYAGEAVTYADNNRKLLEALRGKTGRERRAQFRCVAAFVADDCKKSAEGICAGSIIDDPRGSGGFGYDPLFVPDGYSKTFAELPADIKNQISHRALAFKAMLHILTKYFRE
jgi:XTP/dITP diphosphohydrolase